MRESDFKTPFARAMRTGEGVEGMTGADMSGLDTDFWGIDGTESIPPTITDDTTKGSEG